MFMLMNVVFCCLANLTPASMSFMSDYRERHISHMNVKKPLAKRYVNLGKHAYWYQFKKHVSGQSMYLYLEVSRPHPQGLTAH